MRRDSSLSDILSDSTGNLRPEVADLLDNSEPVIPESQNLLSGRIIFWMIVISIVLGIVIGMSIKNNHYKKTANMQDSIQKANGIKGLGRGKVFGTNVNIRQMPSLKGQIIRKTNHGETFKAISFSEGWYQVMLEDNQRGYIFGAYLLPMDFRMDSYHVGTNKKGEKMLLTPSGNPDYYMIITPNSERRYIKKNDVHIIR